MIHFIYLISYFVSQNRIQRWCKISKNRVLPIRVDQASFDQVQKAAEAQGISQAEVARQSLFFGLSESNYYRVIEIGRRQGVPPRIILQEAFSLADALMNPDMSVSDVLEDANPSISFADAMKSLPELHAVLIAKIERAMEQKRERQKKKDEKRLTT